MIKKLIFLTYVFWLLEAPVFGELTVSQINENYADSVVTIFTFNKKNQLLGSGSGFFINGNGDIVTNRHVLEGNASALIKTKKGELGDILKVFQLHENPDLDLVIATTTLVHTKPLLVGDSDSVTLGQDIVVIGNPEGFEGTISKGIVSGKREFNNMKWIQITAPISHGSSGGPVFNLNGEIIGVTTAQSPRGQNLNFAIPANYLLNLKSMDIPFYLAPKKERKVESLPNLGEKPVSSPSWSPIKMPVPFSQDFSTGPQDTLSGEGIEPVTDTFQIAKAEPSDILRQQLDKIQEEELVTTSAGLEDVFFQFDSWFLTTEAKESLERDLEWLIKDSTSLLVIEGHADQRGTQAYNMVLGKKRAMAIRDYLIKLRVDPSRLYVISYGKEKPFCQDPTEVCHQLNRRGHLLVQN